ncbi:MAG TPA: SEC-C metal-binding domain-containing protein [Cellvibrionaceae bacterium]
MSSPVVLTPLTAFLHHISAQFKDVFSPHQALGALVSGLGAPIELSAEELLELVLNQETDSAAAVLADAQNAIDWQAIVQGVDELMADEQWLLGCYSPVSIPPGNELAQWCDGYLQAYWYCEDVWQEFYSVWEEIAASSTQEDDDLHNVAESHPVLINMVFLIAHWDSALTEMENLEELPENVDELFAEITEGVTHFYLLMREMSASVTQVSAPVIKSATANRNDPCPCGSGKKFKKCCLN